MSKVRRGRFTSNVGGDGVVLFVIGMRVNRVWRLTEGLPVAVAMPRMIIELRRRPVLGLLSPPKTYVSGRVIMVVQYWESFDKLESYARASDAQHLPAWRRFNRAIRDNGSVGIFHETYRVTPGVSESVYVNMPLFGLAGATTAEPASHIGNSAARRMGLRDDDTTPVAPY
jgi:hypothetical protein